MITIQTTYPEGTHDYMLFSIAAFVTGIVISGIVAAQKRMPFHVYALVVAAGTLGMITGSKLILMDAGQWISFFHTFHLPAVEGKSVIGAIAGGMLGAWAAGKFLGYKKSVLDLFAVAGPLGLAVQRIGCLFAGCCHGIVTSLPWAVKYGPGSTPYLEQQQLGLIPPDALTSLPVHPDQLYNSLACLLIGTFVWKTSQRWKSPSGALLVSVILYMTVRFLEEFLRFEIQPEFWFGLQLVQWKALSGIILFSLILYFRERKYAAPAKLSATDVNINAQHWSRAGILVILLLWIAFQLGSWMSGDEQRLMVYVFIPLCIAVGVQLCFRLLMIRKFGLGFGVVIMGLALMSQKADVPPQKPKSYTTFNITTALGHFDNQHGFNYVPTTEETDCGPQTIWKSDQFIYRHAYKILGVGVGRKVNYNEHRSLMMSLMTYGGIEKENPIQTLQGNFAAPAFTNTLFGVEPMLQYDTKGFGLGLGVVTGNLGFGESSTENHKDYSPRQFIRKSGYNLHLRLFNEQHFFVELDKGNDAGTLGQNSLTQLLIGSRFNSENFMLKAGIAHPRFSQNAFMLQGQMPLSPRLIFSTSLLFRGSSTYDPYPGNGFRGTFSFEYRFFDKRKKRK